MKVFNLQDLAVNATRAALHDGAENAAKLAVQMAEMEIGDLTPRQALMALAASLRASNIATYPELYENA